MNPRDAWNSYGVIWPTTSEHAGTGTSSAKETPRIYEERVPSFLLRQFYQTNQCVTEKRILNDKVLCPFNDAVAKFDLNAIPDHTLYPHWFPDFWKPQEGHTYRRLSALIVRINVACEERAVIEKERTALLEKNMTAAKQKEKAEMFTDDTLTAYLRRKQELESADFYWRQFISTHFGLLYVLQDSYSKEHETIILSFDQELDGESKSTPGVSWFAEEYPYCHEFFWAGRIPDIIGCISRMGWFWENQDKSKLRLQHVLEKCKLVPCAIRNWRNINTIGCLNHAGMYELQVLVLFASLFRLYPGSAKFPNMKSLIALVKMMRVNAFDIEGMLQWMIDHSRVVWYFYSLLSRFSSAITSSFSAISSLLRF